MPGPKIIVGVDFSAESELAARQAIELARATEGEVVLVHVLASLDPGLGAVSLRPETARALATRREFAEQARLRDRERLAELRTRLAGPGARVSQALNEGDAATSLCDAARDLHGDLTVVGTHGRTGFRWFLLGSVAERVLRAGDGDVLIARGEGVARGGFRRVLVATDFSPSSDRALERALALAARGAEIDVVHFYHGAPYTDLYDQLRSAAGRDVDELLLADLRAAGQLQLERIRRDGHRPEFRVVREAPLPGIIHRSEREPYDLIALGGHGNRGLRRLMLGSVAEAVSRRAPCSVLVARGAPAGARP